MSLLSRTRERAGWLVEWLPALALAVAAQAEAWAGGGLSTRRAVDALALLVIMLSLGWRMRAPVAVAGVVAIGATLEFAFLDGHGGTALVAVLIAVYSLGAHAGGRARDVGVIVVVAAIGAAEVVAASRGDDPAFPGVWLLLAVPFGLGCVRRWQRLDSLRLHERAARLEREQEEQARRAVAEERARIARDLHDVVAHAISLIVVQARAGRRTPGGEAGATRESLDTIEETGRQALGEMRRLVGLLRTDADEPALGPQPGLAQLEALVNQVTEAGLPVALRTDGAAIRLPAGIEVSAYRIVQEALTNALRHAGPATASVILHYRADELELEVVDTGPSGRVTAAADERAVGRGGHGLVGMRERVSIYGGELEAGGRDDGGFAVRARLPFDWARP